MMDIQQFVIERTERCVLLKCDLHSVRHPGMLTTGRGLMIPYQVSNLNGTAIKTKADNAFMCYVVAEHFSFDFGRYEAKRDSNILIWLLVQIGETIDKQLAPLQFVLTAQPARCDCESPEYFHPQVKTAGDSTIRLTSFANHENHLVRWSEFFEEGDPIRREIHTAYQELYRDHKSE